MMAGTEPDPPGGGNSYRIRDVGAGARVLQGVNNSLIERAGALPGGDEVAQGLAALIGSLKSDSRLGQDDQELAVEKVQAVADALPQAAQSPERMRKALRDAGQFLGGTAMWAWDRLRKILSSEAGQQVLGTIADATAKAAISGLLGIPVS
jgi:hypothetical protein